MTTLDYNIQQYAEQAVKETMEAWPSENVAAIVMNPNTGEIYAMASADTFDLNDPDEPTALATDETFKETWDAMTDQEKSDYLNTIWRNFCVSVPTNPVRFMKPLDSSGGIGGGRNHEESLPSIAAVKLRWGTEISTAICTADTVRFLLRKSWHSPVTPV